MQKFRLIVAASAAFLLAAPFFTGADAQTTKRIKDLSAATDTVTGDIVPIDGATLRGITVENFLKPSVVAIKALTPAANKCVLFTSTTAAALIDCPSYGRSLLATSSAGGALTALGVSAYAQTILDDANAGAVQTTLGISAFIQTLLDDANAATARTTLGVGTGTGDLVSTSNLSDVANAATAFGNIKQAATTSATGVVELATAAEMVTGTDTARAPSVSVVKNHQGVAKGWAFINSSGTLLAGYNVASARTTTGTYTATFSVPFSSANYACIASTSNPQRIAGITLVAGVATTITRDASSLLNVDQDFYIACYGDQ